MKVAVMQPYFFPYIGYFQLIHDVDQFVLYDDVQFIQRGWINRNRMLNQGTEYLFTLPLTKAPRSAAIKEREINANTWEREKTKLKTLFERNYSKAPYFENGMNALEYGIACTETNIVDFLQHTLESCCLHIGIQTPFIRASTLDIEEGLRGEERILQICTRLGAKHYVNAIGGQDLYNHAAFSKAGLELSFIKTGDIRYTQFSNTFIPWLSILDVFMFNPVDRIQEFLGQYEHV